MRAAATKIRPRIMKQTLQYIVSEGTLPKDNNSQACESWKKQENELSVKGGVNQRSSKKLSGRNGKKESRMEESKKHV